MKQCDGCGNALSKKQRRWCSSKCRSAHTNVKYQSYEAQQLRGLERKLQFVLACGGRCASCGYKENLAALVFHHINENTKSFELDMRSLSNRKEAVCREELAKCLLLCANCHATLHNPRLSGLVDKAIEGLQFGRDLFCNR